MSRQNKGIGSLGFYMTLLLCAAAIGITGILYYQNAHRVQEVSLQEEETVSLQRETVKATEPTQPETTAPTETTAPRVLKTAAPVEGETIYGYAMDCLSYNQTTRDWRTHNGIDLAAEEGDPVRASAAGTVYTTYEDDTMGYTVVIRHEGGYTTRYANLSPDLLVSAGDTVTLGQPIGTVGCTALMESAMGSHVHFSVTYQDNAIAPEEFFALG